MRSFRFSGTEYDSVIFDCDGVLLDSNQLKIGAFRKAALASGFDKNVVRDFSEWQSQNFGTSRYRVFETLLSGRFGEVPEGTTPDDLLSRFSESVRAGYVEVAESTGLHHLLEMLAGVPLYVASGSDEQELREVLHARGLARFFVGIYGSPAPKSQLVGRILTSRGSTRSILIGDAHVDADAAQENSIDFIFVKALSVAGESMSARAKAEGFAEYQDLGDLATAIGASNSLANCGGKT